MKKVRRSERKQLSNLWIMVILQEKDIDHWHELNKTFHMKELYLT